jgi:hypothetical protein
MAERKASPGRWPYLLALIIFGAGVILGIALIVNSVLRFRDVSNSFVRVVAPGTTTVHLKERGNYTIYYEYDGEVDGVTYTGDETPPSMIVEITSKKTGQTVAVNSDDSGTYTIDSSSGIAVMDFSIDDPGDYQITTRYSDGSSGGEVVFAIGHGIARDIVWGVGSIFGSIAVFCFGSFVAFVIVVLTFILRQRKPAQVTPPAPPAPLA